jgi:hypothetical protein
MTWRVHCRVFGPSAEPRWFVTRDLLSGAGIEYVTTPHGRPLPFSSEQDAYDRAEMLNAGAPSVTEAEWLDISTRC